MICTICGIRETTQNKRRCEQCQGKLGAHVKRWRQANRLAALHHYGGPNPICACCKEPNIGFLTLDHINGGGTKHRKTSSSSGQNQGNYFFKILKDLGYPPDYQVLCYNCNTGKWTNGGTCPHVSGPLLGTY